MKKIWKFNYQNIVLMILIVAAITSCDKADPADPASTITLNMLNESYSKTNLGESDVYINKSNNFYAPSNYIADIGGVSGVGVSIAPMLDNLTREVAVTPGHAYQVFDKRSLVEFPSGKRAIEKGAGYYQVYAVSQILNDNITTGAVVKYFLTNNEGENLPDLNHKIGVFHNKGEELRMQIPKGAECVLEEIPYQDVEEIFIMSVKDGVLSVVLNEVPSSYSGPYGPYIIYVRVGSVYTIVKVNVLV